MIRFMSIKYNNIEKVVHKLMDMNYTMSFMEGCTGGALADAFTNIKGVSHVLKFGAIAYNTETKILLGVNPKLIERFGDFSTQISKAMAKAIALYSNTNIGVGITGYLGLITDKNVSRESYISIYVREKKEFITKVITVKARDRESAKEAVTNFIVEELVKVLNA